MDDGAVMQALGGLLDATELGAGFIAPSVRLLCFVVIAPVLGGGLLPRGIRIATAFPFALLGALLVAPTPPTACRIALEASVGVGLGLLAALPLHLAGACGQLMDTARAERSQLPEVLVTHAGHGSPLSIAMQLALLVRWGVSGIDAELLATVLAMPPPGPEAGYADLMQLFATALVAGSSAALEAAASVAAPVLLVGLLLDLALGMVGRFSPALPLYFLGLPLRSLGLLAVVAVALAPEFEQVSSAGDSLLALFLQSVERARGDLQ